MLDCLICSSNQIFNRIRIENQSSELPGYPSYELEVCADPAFAPWAVMAQRLSSAGLLQMVGDDGTDTPAARVKAAPLVVVRTLRHNRGGIV